jgi:hypothetical protein
MLFDLRGRRRRAVQATYLTLAVLMGGGLVFFGIGGDVSGGLFDAFSGNSGGGSANDVTEKRIEHNQRRAANGNTAAMEALIRDYYSVANSKSTPGATQFPEEARGDLRSAAAWWQRYEGAAKKPNPDTAIFAFRIYDVGALNQPKQAAEALRIVAAASNQPVDYIRLVQYATLAGDTRTADLAGQKAVDLAPKAEKSAVRAQVKQAKQTQAPQAQG